MLLREQHISEPAGFGTPKPSYRQSEAEDSRLPYKTSGGRSFTPNSSPSRGSESSQKWHQRWIERFFATPETKDPLQSNGRLYVVLAIFLLGFSAVVGKLFKVQVVDHEALSEQAASQYRTTVVLPARRGVVTDRNGVILATNAFVVRFAVDPQEIKNKPVVAAAFSSLFGKPKEHYMKFLNDTTRRYIIIERDVPQDIAAKLDTIKEHGLIRETTTRRSYAFGDRASHILGFSSKDGRGLAGIELFSDKVLRGEDGLAVMQRDGKGGKRPDVDYDQKPAANGDNITLTIDERIQSATEAALKRGVLKANALAGIVIVMNPRTGEILALANAPDFDPNDFFSASNDMLRNRAITDAFEPGSTMKVITAAIALEEKAFKDSEMINAEGGTWTIEGGAKIRDVHAYGALSFRQALEKSSNVCFAKISDRIEHRRFYKYMRDFGFGVLSGIDLPGEIKGYMRKPHRWDFNSKRYISFGYAMTCTPIQMAAAYAAIANDGVMMKPYIVSKRTNAAGETTIVEPQEIRRVVSVETARHVRDIMRGVVDSGTATNMKIQGIAIGGKTGTAQQLVNGRYSKEHYTSSFVGLFPIEQPEYEILVILRSPRNGYYGGAVSGPIFREIALAILDMDNKLSPAARNAEPVFAQTFGTDGSAAIDAGVLEIEGTTISMKPIAEEEESDVRDLPDVRGLSVDAARSYLASQGFVITGETKKGLVDAIDRVGGDTVRIIAREVSASEKNRNEPLKAPNYIGMPILRAYKAGAVSAIKMQTVGEGIVIKQLPEPGALLDARNPTITLFGEE